MLHLSKLNEFLLDIPPVAAAGVTVAGIAAATIGEVVIGIECDEITAVELGNATLAPVSSKIPGKILATLLPIGLLVLLRNIKKKTIQ